MNPKFFIGPMSKNVVDTIIEFCNDNNVRIGLIPSRRQIDFSSGYVNNWTTQTFSEYIKSKTNKIILVRDHGGPDQGDFNDDGIKSLETDVKFFNIIHIDVWKKYGSLYDGIQKTIEYIKYCYGLNPTVTYEISTEQSIRPFSVDELQELIVELKKGLPNEIYNQIKYMVVQFGTSLLENHNTGSFCEERSIKMLELCKKNNLLSKEHNGDYQSIDLINKKFNLGLDSINIAPEFGVIETQVILNHTKNDIDFFNLFFDLCYYSKRWEKWVNKDFDPTKNKEKTILICGHYVFSNPKFLEYMEKNNWLIEIIKKEINNKLSLLMSRI